MEQEQLTKAFGATVQASLHGLQSLEPILRREQSALASRDPEILTAIVQEKVAALKQLEPSIQARDTLQAAAGMPEGIEGGSRLVEMLDRDELTRDWAQLTRMAKIISELNDRNGSLALQGQRRTREALGILTGRSPSNNTYSTLRGKKCGTASFSFGRA
jgi:flagellar biosynthesis/type III secretory pathway chaperone